MIIGVLAQQPVPMRRPPFDGPANHLRHVAQALHDRGHQVRVLANVDGSLWRTDDLVHFHPVKVRLMDRGPLRWIERAVRRVQYELRLPYVALFESVRFALACRQELAGCDLLYERMSWVGYGGALASRWLHRPLVLENNGDHLADLEAKGIAPRGAQRRLSLACMTWAVRQAAHIVTTGEGWRDQFLQRYPGAVPAERVSTVENGTDLVHLLPRELLRPFQAQQAPDDPVTVAYVGGFLPWQGVPLLIQALARARQQGANVRLLLIGAGPGLADAADRVMDLGLEAHVAFGGPMTTEQFAPLLAAADMGASPYCDWPEFSGLKILDYKAAGLPAIVSGHAAAGRPATVRHGKTGWIVPPCDEETLVAAILSLAGSPELRQFMGQAARLEAEAQHGWDHTARQLEQIFEKVLDR